MIVDKNLIITSVVYVAREEGNKLKWFVVKDDEDKWTFPTITKRKVESSVKAAIRLMQEKGSMEIRVVEEAGRQGSMITVDSKPVSKRIIYYSAIEKSSSEAVGFPESKWADTSTAKKLITGKKEKQMLDVAKEQIEKFLKEKREEEEEVFDMNDGDESEEE